ncbi:DUF222 domain-containing protein [Agromyces sp. NPDC057865]|uniref:HNH endonuclease signature motif containing protein n=1 Tax=Agromyces sp. NPDC057865 TaxID=3346267 RepID=UPI00366FC0EA
MPIAIAAPPQTGSESSNRSPFAIAQDGLAGLVDAAVQARRLEAMQAAMRVDVINLAVDYAMRSADAFTAPSLSPERRREVARRAVIAELATALRIPERTMTRLVSESWTLANQLPVTLAALRLGDIDESHARVVIDETGDVADGSVRARLDLELVERAATMTAASLRRAARRLRETLQAESLEERHAHALAERRIELEPARDGMAWLHLHLPASDALLIRNRLDRVAADVTGETGEVSAVADARTPDQLRADVARDLLLHGVPPIGEAFHVAAATVRPTVHVTVPVLTLLGLDDAPADLEGYGPIDPEMARRLAAQAPSFTRILTHPVSGTVLDVDRTTYRPPADLARWLRVRDETCRFPGCNRRAARCELDHTEGWADLGSTSFDNLAHLCPYHHHLKHESSWSVRHLEHGTLEWRSPAGRQYVTGPSVRIPARAAPDPTRTERPDPVDPARSRGGRPPKTPPF